MKIRVLMVTAVAFALAACGASEQATTADNVAHDNMAMDAGDLTVDNAVVGTAMPATGHDYATLAAGGDMYEIESSRLAIDKSQNADVKQLAQMIVTDHEKATADLKTAAGRAQPPITVVAAMNPGQQANLDMLRAADTKTFDQIYLRQQVAAHQEALAMIQAYAATGEVLPLKEHATAVAGPIQKHLGRAQQLIQQPR